MCMSKAKKRTLWVVSILIFCMLSLTVLADYGDYIDVGMFRQSGEIYVNGTPATMSLGEAVANAKPGEIGRASCRERV